MVTLPNEVVKKLEELRAQLVELGFNDEPVVKEQKAVSVENEEEKKQDERIMRGLSDIEKEILIETKRIWNVSTSQALMIYRSIGTVKGLNFANNLRTKVKSKELTYEQIEDRLRHNDSLVTGYESMTEKHSRNMEAILSGEITPAEEIVLRKTNEQFEKLLSERAEQVQRANIERSSLCATIYFGKMIDQLEIEEKRRKAFVTYENSRLLPGFKQPER